MLLADRAGVEGPPVVLVITFAFVWIVVVLEFVGVFFFVPWRTSKGRCAAEQKGAVARRVQISAAVRTVMTV